MPTTLLKRLEQVAAEQRRRRADQRQQDLAIFTDAELEELCALAQKADSAKRLGQVVDWTAEDFVALDQVETKLAERRAW